MGTGQIEVLADLDEVKPNTPEWYRLRRTGVGGSDAAAIAGASRFGKTQYSVWVEKVSEGTPKSSYGEVDDWPEYILWGHILEEPVREEFARRTGVNVMRFPRMVRNTESPFAFANLDGLTGSPDAITGVYEGKTSRYDWWNGGEVEVPLDYAIQGQHYLGVLGLDVVHYACLVGGRQLRVAEIERNDKVIDDLFAIEQAFWDRYVITGNPPPVSGTDVALLKGQFKADAEKRVELPESFAKELRRRARYKAWISSVEKRVEEIDAPIMALMGDAVEATIGGKVAVTWKQSADQFDARTFKEQNPKVAAQYQKPGSRRFLPKEIKS